MSDSSTAPSPTARIDLGADAIDAIVARVTATGVVVSLDSAASRPPVGQDLTLTWQGATRDGWVAWAAGSMVAVALQGADQDHGAFLTREILKQKDPRERRKFPRCSVLMSGTVRSQGVEVPCVVQNLSLGGVRLRVMDALSHDGRAILNIPRFGDFESDVAWQSNDSMGLQFLATPQQVADLIGEALPRVLPPSFVDSQAAAGQAVTA